jgi:hypothetical protein
MKLVIRFDVPVAGSPYGKFAAGDLFRCSPMIARYFVRDLEVAQFESETRKDQTGPIVKTNHPPE